MLLDREQAAKRLGRHPTVIRDWHLRGVLPVARYEGRRALYDARALLAAAREMRRRYQERSHTPGSGRGHRHPATAEIRDRIKAGESTRDILNAIGCSERTVRRNRRELAEQDALEASKSTPEGKDAREQ